MKKLKPEISKLDLSSIREHVKQLERLDAEIKRHELYNLIITKIIWPDWRGDSMEMFKALKQKDEGE